MPVSRLQENKGEHFHVLENKTALHMLPLIFSGEENSLRKAENKPFCLAPFSSPYQITFS